jgi:hypothetical protein
MLVAGASLMVLAGLLFAVTGNLWLLLLSAFVGVISPSGGEVGPFLAIEHASLSQIVPSQRRADVFAWYNLVGSVAMAMGSLCSGVAVQIAVGVGVSGADAYRPVVIACCCSGSTSHRWTCRPVKPTRWASFTPTSGRRRA